MLTNEVSHDINMLLETPGIGGNMDSSIEGPDKVPKQLMAFEKLLRHAISRFSKENLYDLLLTLNAELDTPRSRGGQRITTGDPNRKIRSMKQVRDLIKTIEDSAIRGKASDHELRSLKSFEVFDKDVRYLRDLKAYFDSNIYKSLNEEYYDPNDFQGPKSVPTPQKVSTPMSSGSARKAVGSRQSKASRDYSRLPEVVSELQELMGQWSELLSDGNLDINIFDPDSHHELLQFENYHSFEPILRLVPDVFVKSYKAIDLGREWLALANKIYGDRLPLGRRISKPPTPVALPPPGTPSNSKQSVRSRVPSAEVDQRVKEVKHHIGLLNKDISEKQETIVRLTNDEKKLSAREKRADVLTNNFEQVDNKMQRAQRDYQKAVSDLDRANEQIKFLPNNSPKYMELYQKCRNIEYEIEQKQTTLQMLEFEKSVVQEDYLLELELRPHFIHYVGDIQDKIDTLKASVKEKQNAKKQLEKQIVLIKTTKSDSINRSMKKYLNGELAYDLDALTHKLELAEQHDGDRRSIKSAASGTSYSDSDVDLTEYLVDGGRQPSESDLQYVYDADGEKAGMAGTHARKDIIGKPRIPESVLDPTQQRQKVRVKVS